MYPIALGMPFSIEEITLDTNFTGATEYGRASATLGSTNTVTFVAKLYGTLGNAYSVVFINRGIASSLAIRQVGALIEVTLRRSVSAILSTPQEVADAINAMDLPVRATWTGTDPLIAVVATPLTGGLNPTQIDPTGSRFQWRRTTGQVGGLFFFENLRETVIVTGVECKFTTLGGTETLTIERVNLDAATGVIASSGYTIKEAQVSPSAPRFSIEGIDGIPILPYQAMRVICASRGYVQVNAQRLSRHPYG